MAKRKRVSLGGPTVKKAPDVEGDPIDDVDESVQQAIDAIQARLSRKHLPTETPGLSGAVAKLAELAASTVLRGESNSVLLIGPRNTGKSMTIRKALATFQSDNFVTVWLNGLFQTTDQIAVKEIVRQLHLETQIEGARPTNVSDCLKFVIETLNSGTKENVPVVFVLEEFDLFALHPKQSLLYTLFDIAQTCVNPVFVIGASQRQDSIELLEKRVKSRFSHRIIFTYAPNRCDDMLVILKNAVSLSEEDGIKNEAFRDMFNETCTSLMKQKHFKVFVQGVIDGSADIMDIFKVFTFMLLSLSPDQPYFTSDGFKMACSSQLQSPIREIFNGISPLEQVLLVAIKQCLVRHIETFNFEMVFEFYRDFVRDSKAGSLTFTKDVAFKAFESLHSLELINLVDGTGNRCPKRHRMFKVNLSDKEICRLIEQCEECLEVVKKWCLS
ncbi:origin recognition complex subunit 4 C-terminus-domain-containing protein [Chytriomyces sp. MP71]|nr:origin recognition complex subunit 4 C-terminus-domain-containing protein [Chytriomyces sp. MP71]